MLYLDKVSSNIYIKMETNPISKKDFKEELLMKTGSAVTTRSIPKRS